jgi:hypothetical protein
MLAKSRHRQLYRVSSGQGGKRRIMLSIPTEYLTSSAFMRVIPIERIGHPRTTLRTANAFDKCCKALEVINRVFVALDV